MKNNDKYNHSKNQQEFEYTDIRKNNINQNTGNYGLQKEELLKHNHT